MDVIVDRLPYYTDATTVRVPAGAAVNIKHHQIILWVSLTESDILELPPAAARFPAVFDTGYNDNFLIREQHLADWAGLNLSRLPCVGHLQSEMGLLPLVDANLWLHRNSPNSRDHFSGAPAFRLELHRGVGVTAAGLKTPRLPLLGARAFDHGQLQVSIDCSQHQFSLTSM